LRSGFIANSNLAATASNFPAANNVPAISNVPITAGNFTVSVSLEFTPEKGIIEIN